MDEQDLIDKCVRITSEAHAKEKVTCGLETDLKFSKVNNKVTVLIILTVISGALNGINLVYKAPPPMMSGVVNSAL